MSTGQEGVFIAGQPITDYLYGNSARIMWPMRSRGGFTTGDLHSIEVQVGRNPGLRRFGVGLKPVKSTAEIRKGALVMCLTIGRGCLTKAIVRITDVVERGDRKYAQTRTEWPKHAEGFEGFFTLEESTVGLDDQAETLRLHYVGKIPQDAPASFYERVMGLSADLKVLIECWAIVHSPELVAENYFSFDIFERTWTVKFGRMHGNEFQHELVRHTLFYASYSGSLIGINRVLDDRPHLWEKKDLINPLLEQMQEDILHKLYEDEELVDLIFGDDQSAYWLSRLRVLFERYNSPKQLMVIDQPVDDGASTSAKRTRGFDPKMVRKIHLLEVLIRRTDKPGEKQAAIAAYLRITGVEWVDEIAPISAPVLKN